MSGNWWEVCVGETIVWCDAEDYSWGSVLVLTVLEWYISDTQTN